MSIKKSAAITMTTIVGLLPLLSACSSGTPASSPSPSPSASTAPGESPAANPYETKYDIEFFVPTGSGGSIPSADKDFVKQTIDELFNVNFTVTHMASGPDSTNRMNVRFASNTAPDLAVVAGRDSQTYAKDGLVADMRPYLTPEAMPNYFKWISETELQGYYSIEGVEDGLRAPTPFNLRPYTAWYIRKDWLDNLNLSIPTNYEETLEVIRAFTFDDPDQNGSNDTYGFTTSGNGANVGFDWPQWVHNGFYSSMYVDEGQLIDAGSHPDTGKVLGQIKEMIGEGVVDPNWFLNKGSDHLNRLIEGKAGIVKASGRDFALESVETSAVFRARQINPDAEIVPFNPFPDAKGITSAPQGSWGFVIPIQLAEKEPDKVKRIMDILDYLASPDGFLLTHYGLEGESYTRDGDTVTLNPDVINQINAENGKFLEIYNFFTRVSDTSPIGLEIINPDETDRDRAILQEITSYKYVPYTGGPYVTPPDGINIADYRKEMNTTHANIVFGDLDVEKWPEYLEDLLTRHKGREIFETYTRQIEEGGGFENAKSFTPLTN